MACYSSRFEKLHGRLLATSFVFSTRTGANIRRVFSLVGLEIRA
jgi:hypothetical protein